MQEEDVELTEEEKAAKAVINDVLSGKVPPQDVLDDVEKLFLGQPTKDERIGKIVPFKILSEEEEEKFRQWARDNYDPNVEPDPVWHPVVRDEWAKLITGRSQPSSKR